MNKTMPKLDVAPDASFPICLGGLAIGTGLIATSYVSSHLIDFVVPLTPGTSATLVACAESVPVLILLAGVIVLSMVRRPGGAVAILVRCLCAVAATLRLIPAIKFSAFTLFVVSQPRATDLSDQLTNYEEFERHRRALHLWLALDHLLWLVLIAAFLILMLGVAKTLGRSRWMLATLMVGGGVAGFHMLRLTYGLLQLMNAEQLANLVYRVSGNIVAWAQELVAVAYLLVICVQAARLRKSRAGGVGNFSTSVR